MHIRCLLAATLFCVCAGELLAQEPLVYEGDSGPGMGKHLLFLAGDHEYRSEEALPALARILAVRHGFKCTVLFTLDPQTGEILPGSNHLPGTDALKTADLMVIFTRFQDLPPEQMQPIVDYLQRGGPVVGLRTATHAFKIPQDSQYARFDYQSTAPDFERGFGRRILGESWSGHYGKNHEMSTRLELVPGKQSHPILTGVTDVWVQSGGYWTEPTADCEVLALAQPLAGMTPDSPVAKDKQPCPGAWTRTYELQAGRRGRVFTTTYGASEDLLDDGFRRMLVNACFWASGLEDQIAGDLKIGFLGPYHPSTFRFEGYQKGMTVDDLRPVTSAIPPQIE